MNKTFLIAAILSLILTVSNVFGSHTSTIAGPETKKITISGKLNRTVEKGGWLIVSGKKKFLIVNAGKYLSKSWFVVGAKVEATGSLRNHPTFFMEGQPFKVDKLMPRRTQKPERQLLIPGVFGHKWQIFFQSGSIGGRCNRSSARLTGKRPKTSWPLRTL